ncbi:MAG: cell division protein ZapA [Rhodocyclaceae bacterium]|jgi:cell division protein ZapA|nr:cell division protein ZapA [Rhodocyclaceae bacterium]
MSTASHLDVILFGREYRLACPPEQQAALNAAVTLVNTKMQEVASKGRQVSTERAAIMAALTLAHDLLEAQNPGMVQSTVPVDTGEARRKVERMVQRADDAIESHQNALF